MWSYERRLQFPVKIRSTDARSAKIIISQLGGHDGELAASMRYLNQRYAMPYRNVSGVLTDIGTEELAHMEMISAIIHQLTRDLSMEEIKEQGFADYFVDHTLGIYPVSASGVPFSATYFQSKGDPITDLTEDMAAEQKARTTYDNILRLVDDPDILEPIRFCGNGRSSIFSGSAKPFALCRKISTAAIFMLSTPPLIPEDWKTKEQAAKTEA